MDKQLALFERREGLTPTQQDALVSEFGESFRVYMDAAKAPNTRRVYRAQWGQFEQFCADRGFDPLPAHPAIVKAYLTHLADGGLSLSTVHVAKAAIAYHHGEADLPDPTRTHSIAKLVSGIANTIGRPPGKKDALSLGDLGRMVATLTDDERGKLDRALLLVGFAGAFRRSELVGLDMEHVKVNDGDVRITLPKSKTDQAGRGLLKTIPHVDNPLCAHCALLEWLAARGQGPGAVFRRIVRGRVSDKCPSSRYVARLVQRTAKDAGIVADLGGHSLRSGFVTSALGQGASIESVVSQTGQTYDVALAYDQNKARGATAAVRAAFGDEG
jgi:site-specific recombinase XerD